MLDVLAAFVAGALAFGAGIAATEWSARQRVSTVQSALDAERVTVRDLHDRLAAKTWPEYKAYADPIPAVQEPELVWVGDADGVMGSWVPADLVPPADPSVD